MTKLTSLPAIAGALLACSLSAAPAWALANRTWVSGHGADSGACTPTAPCRTFNFALAQTASGGEIDVLDPAGYGAITITKAISIVNDGVGVAGILASSGNGVTINAGATDSVHLRGLTIEGAGSGSFGIHFTGGKSLAIENCVVRDFTNAGIDIVASTSSGFSVSNTIASNNGSVGIVIAAAGSAVVTSVLSNVTANNNNHDGIQVVGVTAGATINVTIADSVASNNTGNGVLADSVTAAANTGVMVRNVVASNNGTGLITLTNAVLRVAHSAVTGNSTGVNTSGGTLFSYGDNDINGNTSDNTGVLTPVAMH